DLSAEVRMAAASGLRKTDAETALNVLREATVQDKDYRVRVNAVKSLGSFPFPDIRDVLFKALHDSVINVAIAAAEVVQSVATEAFVKDILHEARTSTNWRVQALLYQGVNWL